MTKLSAILLLLVLLSSCHKDEVQLITRKVNSNTSYDLNKVFFVNDSVGYACGGTRYGIGVLLRTTDGGQNWRADSVMPKACYAMYFFSTLEGMVGGFGGNLTQTIDGGNTTTPLPTLDGDPIEAITFKGRNQAVAVFGAAYNSGKVYSSIDGGASWTKVYRDSMHAFMCAAYADDSTVIVGGYGTILRSVDGGRTFRVAKQVGDFYQSIVFPTNDIGYAVGYQGEVTKTNDRGYTWTTARNTNTLWSDPDHLLGVDFITASIGYAVGESGLMIRTTNGGSTWQTVKAFTDKRLKSVHLFTPTSGIVVGEGGAIYLFRE
jgi:photosystem II stability/assembly factor-like uncharacterized protein